MFDVERGKFGVVPELGAQGQQDPEPAGQHLPVLGQQS
jgi:hypothetical protein